MSREPHCCQTVQEAYTVRWNGKVVLYVNNSGVVEADASYCPFCGSPLPPNDHPMRQFCSDEVLALYDDAMRRAQEAEQANIRLREIARKLREAHTGRQFAKVARLADRIAGPEGSQSWKEPVDRREAIEDET